MKWFLSILLFPVLWGSSCQPVTTPAYSAAKLDTTLFSEPERSGVITSSALAEVSGLAPGIRNPGYLWAEEDSGNPSQIQLIDPGGRIAGQFTLPALTNSDWEDIATARRPGTGQPCIYIADIGDNAARPVNRLLHRLMHWKASKLIYRFPEPLLAAGKRPVSGTVTGVETLTLVLPFGPRDIEALLVEPVTNDIYLLTKGSDCEIYRATYPQLLTAPTPMQHLLTLSHSKVTAAAISPNGREILIRTYRQLYYYERRRGETVAASLERPPRLLPLAGEPQGEAVAWRLDGSGYYTTTELLDNKPQFISFYRRMSRAPGGGHVRHE